MKHAKKLIGFTALPATLLYAISNPAAAFVIAVPEPDTLMLFAGGIAVALLARKAKGRK